jgi:peptide/nickel transport system substrate-binding protein
MYLNRLYSFAILVITALVLAACPQPAPIAAPSAGDTAAQPSQSGMTSATDPVRGGVWVEGTSADGTILNPILSSDSTSSDIHSKFFLSLITVDAFTGEVVGQLAEDWDVSDDGLIWTFNLRDDIFWSDGEPLDGNDFKFTYDAIASDLVETPRKSNVAQIDSITVIDDYTVEVVFADVKCDGLLDLGLGILPSHLYASDFSDIMTSPLNEAPAASVGYFTFNDWIRDQRATGLRNESYYEGAPYMDGWIYKVVPDDGARLAQLQTGELTMSGLQPEQIATARLDPNIEIFSYQDDGYSYIGLNLADPANPQPAIDADGNRIDQDPHPILSDRQVRLAMAHALDYQTIIDNVYLGQGYPIASNVLPAVEWAHDSSIQPYAYDPELAIQILEEAGWVDTNGDGIREKDGMQLTLNLKTNAGNTTREDLGALVQDQLNAIGFNIVFEAIEFGTLVGELLGQTFDMVIIGWTGLGTDANDDSFWHSRFDTPGSGFNFVSYNNPRIDELLDTAVSVPGCDPAERAPYYYEIQRTIHDDIPYLFITGTVGNVGYSNKWMDVNPGPWIFFNETQRWNLAP